MLLTNCQRDTKRKEMKTFLTSVLQKDSNTSLFSLGCWEVKQCPAVGITDLWWVSLLQHSPDRAHIPRRHCSLDLQLFMKLRVPSAVVVQHPVTFRNGNVHLYLTSVRKNQWIHSVCWWVHEAWLSLSFWLSCLKFWSEQTSCFENILPFQNNIHVFIYVCTF